MFDGPGKVAMQKAADGQHAHATQFFITVKEQSRWDLDIPIFAVVERGQGAVDAIQQGDAVERITIEGDPAPLLARFQKEVSEWNAALDRTLPRSAKSQP
jgi:peptidyl-prolyl cis-trans isomerase B (cyclophilin B)